METETYAGSNNDNRREPRENTNTKTKLLCTFVSKRKLCVVCNRIMDNFDVDRNRIFVLKDKNIDPDRYILTYNIVVDLTKDKEQHHKIIPNTIPINRKKEFNCLYTIDALNAIIIEQTGEANKGADVKWEKFADCLLVARKDGELVVVETELESIQIF